MKKFAKKFFESIWPLIFEFSQYILEQKKLKKNYVQKFHIFMSGP